MRILVTGAAGFVGQHLLPRLAGTHEVVAIVRQMPASPLPASKTIVADLSSPSLGTRLPRDIDVIVHLAQAYKTFPDHAAEIFAVNAVSTQRLADHARTSGVRRFILASSGSVYSPAYAPLRESDAPRPMGFHPGTKYIAEQLLGYYTNPLEVLCLRLFTPYGPGQVDRLIPRLLASVREGRAITLSRGGEPRLNPIHITDLVEVLTQAIEGAGDGVVNIAGPMPMSIREMAETIGSALGRTPVFLERDELRAGDLIADTSRMHAIFQLGPLIDPRAGIAALAVGETA